MEEMASDGNGNGNGVWAYGYTHSMAMGMGMGMGQPYLWAWLRSVVDLALQCQLFIIIASHRADPMIIASPLKEGQQNRISGSIMTAMRSLIEFCVAFAQLQLRTLYGQARSKKQVAKATTSGIHIHINIHGSSNVAYYHTTIKYDEDGQGDWGILEMEVSCDRDRLWTIKIYGAQRKNNYIGKFLHWNVVKITEFISVFFPLLNGPSLTNSFGDCCRRVYAFMTHFLIADSPARNLGKRQTTAASCSPTGGKTENWE